MRTTLRVKHCYQEANKCTKAIARKGSSQVDEFVILYGPLWTYVFYFNLKKGYGLQTYIFCLIYDPSLTNFFLKKKKKTVHHLKNKNCCSTHKNVNFTYTLMFFFFFSLLIVCYIYSFDFLYSPKIFLKKKKKRKKNIQRHKICYFLIWHIVSGL